MATVTADHVRALCAGGWGRTALVLTGDGPRVVTPDDAAAGLLGGSYLRLLCTRGDLLDEGLAPGRDGALVGRTVEVCRAVAAGLNRNLAGPGGAPDVDG